MTIPLSPEAIAILRERSAHLLKRAEALEAQEERGEGMDGVVVQMMHRYRQLADAYSQVILDATGVYTIT